MSKIDWRTMFKNVVTRMRQAGESHEMGARWMATEADKAVSGLAEENRRLREALQTIADYYDDYFYEGDKEYQGVIVARAALSQGQKP